MNALSITLVIVVIGAIFAGGFVRGFVKAWRDDPDPLTADEIRQALKVLTSKYDFLPFIMVGWIIVLMGIPTGIFVLTGHPFDKSIEGGFMVCVGLMLVIFGALSQSGGSR